MLENDTIIKVTNRDNCYIGYRIPEMNNLRRRFAPGESKDLPMDELKKLAWSNGGRSLIKNHLIIHNEEAVQELIGEVEPEYFYNMDDVKNLLNYGSTAQLLDTLDFAPEGVVSLVKDMAVETKLNDVRKREIIREKTNFNVDKAIEYSEVPVEEDSDAKIRRSVPITEAMEGSTGPETPVRRTSAPKYKVVTSK